MLSPAEQGLYYVVKMTGNGSVCVVHKDQLQLSEGGGMGVGATCEVGEGGEAQPAIIIGAGENYLTIVMPDISQITKEVFLYTHSPVTETMTRVSVDRFRVCTCSAGELYQTDHTHHYYRGRSGRVLRGCGQRGARSVGQ